MPRVLIGFPLDIETLRQELPAGITATDTRQHFHAFDSSGFSLGIFAIEWAGNVTAAVVAALIYDAIKKRATKQPKGITVGETRVNFSLTEITKHIELNIEHTASGDSSGEKSEHVKPD